MNSDVIASEFVYRTFHHCFCFVLNIMSKATKAFDFVFTYIYTFVYCRCEG